MKSVNIIYIYISSLYVNIIYNLPGNTVRFDFGRPPLCWIKNSHVVVAGRGPTVPRVKEAPALSVDVKGPKVAKDAKAVPTWSVWCRNGLVITMIYHDISQYNS